MQDGERTEFELELRSWVLTSIHTYRYTQDWSCLACCGACCCCSKADYSVDMYTSFGLVKISGADAEVGSSNSSPLEDFLRSLMRQPSESPLTHAVNDPSLRCWLLFCSLP